MTTKVESQIKQAKAMIGDLHIAPRKVRIVADLIRNRPVVKALEQLAFLPKKSSKALMKLLNSALANAQNNYSMDVSKLRIKDIRVDQGRVLTRFKARAQGRVSPVRHRTSRVSVVLVEDATIKSGPAPIMAAKKEKAKKVADHDHDHDHEQHEHSTEEKVEKVVPQAKQSKPSGKSRSNFTDFKKRFFNRKSGT